MMGALAPASRAGIDENVHAVAGAERDPAVARQERLGRLAVDGHHPCRMPLEAQAQDARIGGIDEPQAQPLVGLDRDIERRRTVDGQMRPDAAVMGGVVQRTEARLVELSLARQPPIVEHQHDIAVDGDRGRLLDDQHAVKPALELLRRVEMGVVPKGAGIRRAKAVVEARAGSDRGLGQMRHAVHGVGKPHAVPVNDGRLRQLVDEANANLLASLYT